MHNGSGRTFGGRGRTFGLLMVAVAAVLWSTAGLFVRRLDLDVWTMLGWRSVFAALSLGVVALYQNRNAPLAAVRGLGWPGVAAVPVGVISMIGYVASLKLTTVANVMVVYATVPFVAAGVAFLWIGERAARRVLVASGIALLGIVLMAGSATRPQDIAGNAIAFAMTAAFAVQLVMARRFAGLQMAVVNAIAAGICALLSWPFMAAAIPSAAQLAILAAFGVTTTALAYLLFLTGARHIPSGEAGLIGLLDVVLGPLWVWLAFDEQPGPAALLGGGLVLIAVLWYLTSQHFTKPRAVP